MQFRGRLRTDPQLFFLCGHWSPELLALGMVGPKPDRGTVEKSRLLGRATSFSSGLAQERGQVTLPPGALARRLQLRKSRAVLRILLRDDERGPERNSRIGIRPQFLQRDAGELDALHRGIGHRTSQQKPKPVRPVRASSDAQSVPPWVRRGGFSRERFGQDIARQRGERCSETNIPALT